MRRRGLFGALLAAPALAMVPVVKEAVPVVRPAYVVDDQMILDALVLVGGFCPGEIPPKSDMAFFRRLMAEQKPRSIHEAAMLLQPLYPTPFIYRLAQLHANAFQMEWPPVGHWPVQRDPLLRPDAFAFVSAPFERSFGDI